MRDPREPRSHAPAAVRPDAAPRIPAELPPPVLTVHRSDVRRDRMVGSPLDASTISRAGGYQLPLERLYERFDAVASGNAHARGVDLHQVILDRLAANRAHAEAAGWTACALERDGGSGRLRLIGLAPSGDGRAIVPDWTAGVAAEAVSRASARANPGAPRPPRIVRG